MTNNDENLADTIRNAVNQAARDARDKAAEGHTRSAGEQGQDRNQDEQDNDDTVHVSRRRRPSGDD